MKDLIERSLKRIVAASKKAAERAEKMSSFTAGATRESLAELARLKFKGRPLILVSNREPYAHVYRGREISWYHTVGGVSAALDSVAAACGAVWVCHGDAAADFKVADAAGRVSVPPDRPRYTLKRIRLNKAEVQGYYDGFSNKTLWPLCLICYVRPAFDAGDWQVYQDVNRKFADAVMAEAPPGGIVFLQDYHLCLVAKYLRQARPDLTTVLFWHIPWPNPEIFRICPWKRELLEGLLANDILGFHIKYHADNFAETVDNELESRIDWAAMRITRNERATRICVYPISVDFDAIYRQAADPATRAASQALKVDLRLQNQLVALGVDRLDYAKGIPERLLALGWLFEHYPEYRGRLTYIQIGVPTRTHLEDYQAVVSRIENLCLELNARYGLEDWEPVKFMKGYKDFSELLPYYRLADVCIVSSLHDGMNLVAKEFVAAADDERGVLVLSRFAGAARELEQALLVNPYDTVSFGEVLRQALEMPREERAARLARMRAGVAENNIYAWAQAILGDVARLAEGGRFESLEA